MCVCIQIALRWCYVSHVDWWASIRSIHPRPPTISIKAPYLRKREKFVEGVEELVPHGAAGAPVLQLHRVVQLLFKMERAWLVYTMACHK